MYLEVYLYFQPIGIICALFYGGLWF